MRISNPRKSALSGNRLFKYVLYFIGEISLIVAGILIALFINNKNTKEQARQVEFTYLNALKLEFETNKALLDTIFVESEEMLSGINEMLILFTSDNIDTLTNDRCSEVMFNVFGSSVIFQPQVDVMTDLINSGNLNTISNVKIRRLLASFNNQMELLNLHQAALEQTEKSALEVLLQKGSMRSLLLGGNSERETKDDVMNRALFREKRLENYLFDRKLRVIVSYRELYPDLYTNVEKVIVEIEREIKN